MLTFLKISGHFFLTTLQTHAFTWAILGLIKTTKEIHFLFHVETVHFDYVIEFFSCCLRSCSGLGILMLLATRQIRFPDLPLLLHLLSYKLFHSILKCIENLISFNFFLHLLLILLLLQHLLSSHHLKAYCLAEIIKQFLLLPLQIVLALSLLLDDDLQPGLLFESWPSNCIWG